MEWTQTSFELRFGANSMNSVKDVLLRYDLGVVQSVPAIHRFQTFVSDSPKQDLNVRNRQGAPILLASGCYLSVFGGNLFGSRSKGHGTSVVSVQEVDIPW